VAPAPCRAPHLGLTQARKDVTPSSVPPGGPSRPAPRRSLKPLFAVLLMSLAPVIAAVIVYFYPALRPAETTNYGTLYTPQRPMPSAADLPLATLDGQAFDLNSLKGKWVLAAAHGGACPPACARKLFIIRNTHASQGKNVDRLVRVWVITDDEPVPDKVLEAYRGTIMVRAKPEALARYLLDAGQPSLEGPLWIIDPLGNLILHYPPDTDPIRFRKDVSRLVYNSRIG